ncbi:Manganese transport protein MntH [Klebsiella pneumoniae IS43]|uniref:Manganese transport protein MntH n=1 Tax=Klebsiella pneumoniae IS43 TaxID=1432552 RepID=W1DTY1_KLEPN|nr:Manganese transport protein MntH [Klebsiella pneumoniae IS43]
MGPAFVAAIGYIDPGNFATNIQAGASFGYQLLWVVVWANLMAMLIQVLSAKLGIATGKNLAEQIRDHYPRPVVWFYWVQAEIIAMATDLAEFIGAAIGFKLVLGVSLLQGAVLTGVATFSDPDAAAARTKTTGEGDRWIVAVCRRGLCRGVDLFPARAGSSDERAGDPHAAQRGGGILSRRGTGGDHYAARYLLTFLAYPASAWRNAKRTL